MTPTGYRFTTMLSILVFMCAGLILTEADIIANPDDLVGVAHGERIDEAFPGLTLGVGVRNWDNLGGAWIHYATGHAVAYPYEADNLTIGWELATRWPDGEVYYGGVGKYGSQYAARVYSADAVILVTHVDEPTNRVWVDVSNAAGSSNSGISLRAYDADGMLGVRVVHIGRELTRVEYTHPTADIEYFTVDIAGGFWSYPIDAVGAALVPEPSSCLLLGVSALILLSSRRRH